MKKQFFYFNLEYTVILLFLIYSGTLSITSGLFLLQMISALHYKIKTIFLDVFNLEGFLQRKHQASTKENKTELFESRHQ